MVEVRVTHELIANGLKTGARFDGITIEDGLPECATFARAENNNDGTVSLFFNDGGPEGACAQKPIVYHQEYRG